MGYSKEQKIILCVGELLPNKNQKMIISLCYLTPKRIITIEGYKIRRVNETFVFIMIAYIVFFLGFRDVVLDTGAYIDSFNILPDNFQNLLLYLKGIDSGKGFYLFAGLFKILISSNHYVWLFFLASISTTSYLELLYKYSVDFPLTAYLFIATCTFTWLLNGCRQFLVVSIFFGFIDWLIRGEKDTVYISRFTLNDDS